MRTTDMVGVNRNLKDRVFCTLYKEKSRALELYNGINGTNYTDEAQLEIVTLDDAIYMKMHNDVALLINNHLSLYEHQSTRNPNLPLARTTILRRIVSATDKRPAYLQQ